LARRRRAGSLKSPLLRLLYALRNWRSRRLFDALVRHARGRVLDVGGFDFFLTARERSVPFERWTTLEPTADRTPDVDDPRFEAVTGDGARMEFGDASFDTVLAIQVLEHVPEPATVLAEMARVLRPGGAAILLVPQTGTMHFAPHWYGNFSRYWIEGAVRKAGLELVELRPLGGFSSSTASRLGYFFLQSLRYEGMSEPSIRRPPLFYLLWPLMAVCAVVAIPVCLFLSLGDLGEEPENHLAVARKPASRARATSA
jgi:SAM-dependent methyltransferase